jgi:hypothetical protein
MSLSFFIYLFVFALPNPPVLAVALPFSMLKQKSVKDFFKQVCGKGPKNNKDIINKEERRLERNSS